MRAASHRIVFLLLASVAVAQVQPDRDGRIARLYDLGDLVARRDDGTSRPGPDALARLMRGFVKPPLAPGEEITAVGARWIVALGGTEQHAWIDRFLQAVRGKPGELTTIDCSTYSLPEITYLRDVESALAPDADPKAATGTGRVAYTRILAPGKNTDSFLQALTKLPDVETLACPSVSAYQMSPAVISVVNQTAYVRDFDIEVAKAAFIADPVVDVVQDGLWIDTAVVPLEGTAALGLSIAVRIAELDRPIQTVTKTLPGTTMPVTLQLPNLKTTSLEAAVEVAADHIVVCAPPPLNGKRVLFVIRLRPEGTAASAPKGTIR